MFIGIKGGYLRRCTDVHIGDNTAYEVWGVLLGKK